MDVFFHDREDSLMTNLNAKKEKDLVRVLIITMLNSRRANRKVGAHINEAINQMLRRFLELR
jgi:hypothetical protein